MTAARLRARWVVPVSGAPIAGGAVLIDTAGRIAAVGTHEDTPAPAGTPQADLGDVVLMPGLVNTHAHLELTALRGLVTEPRFRDWVRRVRQLQDSFDAAAFADSARQGVRDHFAAGITTIGDTGRSGAAAAAMAELGARGVAYHEVFGPDPAQREASLAELVAGYERLRPHASHRLRIGVSPHAPYTVSAELLAAVVSFARAAGAPVAMHLAESPEETALLRDGTGPFADMWRERGISVAAQDLTPVEWAQRGGVLALQPLLIHCVQCLPSDIAMIAAAGARVAHCPHSNAELRHGAMNLAAMLRAGVWVGLGTDSVVTGAPVDLFREARLARDAAGLEPADAVAMMTCMGAIALGITGGGALAPGAHADLAAIELRGERDPLEAVLAAEPAQVRGTWVGGDRVWTVS